MIGNGRIHIISRWIKPDLVTARGLAVKLEAQLFKLLDNLAILKPSQSAHQVPRING